MATRGIFDSEAVVTSEAVEVDLPAASLPIRMVSGLIDVLVVVLALVLGFVLLDRSLVWADAALAQALLILVVVAVLVGLAVAQETLLRGRTLGKIVMGLRTVREDAGPIGFRHAVIRALVGVVEIWFTAGSLAIIVAATNSYSKRLGDFLAGTYVVRERSKLALPPPPQGSAYVQSWARHADLAALPDGLTVAVRQYLSRVDTLGGPARESTGTRLFGDVLGYVAPPPPAGSHRDDVLATVLAERRRRDTERLERADALRSRYLGPDPLVGARHTSVRS